MSFPVGIQTNESVVEQPGACAVASSSTQKPGENLPFLKFPGNVIYCFKANECESYCKDLLKLCVGNSLTIGFDIEWKPTFVKGDYNKTAVIQICTHSICYVFHVSCMHGCPKQLKTLLRNGNIIKVGVGINGDIRKINKDFGVRVSETIDLGHMYNKMTGTPKRNWGLNNLLMLKVGKKILKSKKITCSNWERPLNQQQLEYASLDAYAGLLIYEELSK